jgi:4-diphosphocytidyl-2-C-methyl-D-erythritol kinase
MSLELLSPGKINLYLKVEGKRPDGYHDIETLFWPLGKPLDKISIADTDASQGIVLESSDLSIPCDSRNLCWKAAELYSEATGISSDWKINLEKNIPVAAGLGGGSGNSAVVLKALNKKYKKLSESELSKIALKIGADVPFFLNPVPALAKGVGENLSPLSCAKVDLPLLIAAPMFPVSAAWAYQNLDLSGARPESPENLIEALGSKDLKKVASHLFNDLATALYNKFPILQMLKQSLLDSGALGAEVSGSGPTMFALYESFDRADSARKSLAEKYGNSLKVF